METGRWSRDSDHGFGEKLDGGLLHKAGRLDEAAGG